MYDRDCMIRFKQFTGGMLATHSYALELPGGHVVIDAPEGADEAFADFPVRLLLLTHGHFDHILDAAKIAQRHGCPVAMHADTVAMVTDPRFFSRFGFDVETDPVEPGFLLDETGPDARGAEILESVGISTRGGEGKELLRIFHVPGHCPGSLCFYFPAHHLLFGGDVLFQGGVGRWDLPGGSQEHLLDGIRQKILPLPGETRVLPGHGPETFIAAEAKTNPYLNE